MKADSYAMTETNLLYASLTCVRRVSAVSGEGERGGGRRADLVVLESRVLDLVGDGERIGESGDVATNLVERQLEVIGNRAPRELLLGLLAEADDRDLLADTLSALDVATSRLADARVDSSAESTVRRDGDVEDLLDRKSVV